MYLFYQKYKYIFNILTKPFYTLSLKKVHSLLTDSKLNFLSLFLFLLLQTKNNSGEKHHA